MTSERAVARPVNRLFIPLYGLGVLAVALALAAWPYFALPPGTQVPVHYGFDGKPTRYGSPMELVVAGLIILAICTVLFSVIDRFEPRQAHLHQSWSSYRTIAVAVLTLFLGVHTMMVLSVMDVLREALPSAIVAMLGAMFVAIGNVMGKTASMALVGFRTPYTLASELSWSKTNRDGGRLFVVVGLYGMVVGLLGVPVAFIAATPVLLIGCVVLAARSKRLWESDPNRREATWT